MSKDITIGINASIDTKIVTKKARAAVTLATDKNLTPKLLFCCSMPYIKSITI
mgnify:CR=1 FL=1